MELYHLVTYSQFFSSIYTGTGLKPTRDFAVLEITDDPPVFEKAFPGIPVFPDSYSLDASWISLIGFPGSASKLISSGFLCINEKIVKRELSVVPDIGIENLLPSSSKKSINVVKESGLLLVNIASTLSFYFVTPKLLPSGKFNSIGNLPTSLAIFGLSSKFS